MEYGFELALCAHLETATDWLPARQLGGSVADPGQRVVDVVGVTQGPAFDRRARITAETIPPAVIEAEVGVGQARDPATVFDTHPDRRAELVEHARNRGFLTVERRDGRELIRQTTRYPTDWFGELVAIENKPDLDRPGALDRQLRVDVSLAVFDRVVLATESHVTRAHLNRLPEPVGVWQFDPDTAERVVVREPSPLATDEPGVEPLTDHTDHTEVAIVPPDAKRRQRVRIAERAYGKGWRPALPACDRCVPTDDGRPYCSHYERVVEPPRDCGTECPGHEPSDPPALDPDAVRADRTPWRRDPEGTRRRQAGLDRFS